jgi:hypothetical protein
MSADRRHRHNRIAKEAPAGGFARKLIYFPIIHSQAEMGALQESVARASRERLGRAGAVRKARAVARWWSQIDRAIAALDLSVRQVRLYQDGLPVCGREAEIVAALAQAGSRNHQLLERLMTQGAVLMGTESADLLVQEYQLAQQSLTGQPPGLPEAAAQRRAMGESLLQRRDQFIAQRINDTLQPGETGILFLGMLHAVERYLPGDIEVIYPLPRPG